MQRVILVGYLFLASLFTGCLTETKTASNEPEKDSQIAVDSSESETTNDASSPDISSADASGDKEIAADDTVADTGSAEISSPDAEESTDVAVEPENPCAKDVLCNSAPPKCEAPLVPVPHNDCWGCGYPKTCSCDDGGEALCDMIPPTCPPALALAAQDGCYRCVDPMTCKVPPESTNDGCAVDADCTLTVFSVLVESIDDCFCPMCPEWSVSKAEDEARANAWNAICSEWVIDNPCPTPKCQLPGDPICEQGQCGLKTTSCEDGVLCFGLPIECEKPFVPAAKDGCWACGYPETCGCSIADTPTCKKMTPECPPGSELAVQGNADFSCWACVDPLTCQEVKDNVPECASNGDCTLTTFDPNIDVSGEEDCYCPMCPTWAVTTQYAAQLEANWSMHCKAWADKQPCLPPPCAPPIGDAQCVEGMCSMPQDNLPPAP